MIKSVLVPLDGSPFGEHALPLAISIARRAKARVNLVHVHAPLRAMYAEIQLYDDTLDEQIRGRNKIYLDDLRQKLEKEFGLEVSTTMQDGEVTPVLREQVAKTAADLVVMTTHARGPVGRFWLGSVADHLIRDVPVPLLMAHPRSGSPDWHQDIVLKNILLPLDGSALAEQIIEPAVNLGSLMNAEYTLLRVVRAVLPFQYDIEGATMGMMAQSMIDQVDKMHEKLKQEAREYLESVAQRLRSRSLQVEIQVTVDDQPGAAIVQLAVPPAIDLVALATHGRKGLTRFFLGSVADKVIRGCSIPALVFRPR